MPHSSWREALKALPYAPLVLLLGSVAATGLYLAAADSAPAITALPDTTTETPAVPPAPQNLWEAIKVRGGDTLAGILSSRGHAPLTVHHIVESGPAGRELASIKVGATLNVATNAQGELSEISYEPDPYRVVNVRRTETGIFESEVIEKPTLTVSRFAEGVIDDSLFAAGKRAGVSDTVILEMADAFGYDIDFALEVQQGDSFRVMYEEILVDGQRVRDGEVLAAEFVNQGKTYRAVRYTTANGRSGYYTPDGMAMRRAFLRTPVDFARISSRFSKARLHPVLHTMRAHKGVDYAAARGTPVKATGDGRVEYAGNKGGYGRVVILRHGNQQSTLYAHLDRFAKNVHGGSRVVQGQVIGYVGSSGLASGPHLHYEFRIGGRHVDPLRVKTSAGDPIAAAEKAAFLAEAGRLVAMMESFSGQQAIVAQARTAPQAQHAVTADL
ncbi:MAG: M23 family metallopeptidase [Pseudomonadota bacterium]